MNLGNNSEQWLKWANLSRREIKEIVDSPKANWDRLMYYSKILQIGRELGNLGYSVTNWSSHTLFVEEIPIETLNAILAEIIKSFNVLLDMFYPLIEKRAKIEESLKEDKEEGDGSDFVV